MIWDEPWTEIAIQKGGTTIPPPKTPLAAGQRFVSVRVSDLALNTWVDLVGSRWTTEELTLRLADAWIPCLFSGEMLVATCVLRFRGGQWILETLRARHGYGRILLRAVIPWLYDSCGGPFTMMYTWELSLPGLVGAFLKGWLRSAVALQYGWVWSLPRQDGQRCAFCPSNEWAPIGPRIALPTLFRDGSGSAIVSDSGLVDGWGYVSVIRGTPDWTSICQKGGWRVLWYRGPTAPAGFRWSGEFVVVGAINRRGPVSLEWVTAEIA